MLKLAEGVSASPVSQCVAIYRIHPYIYSVS